MSIAEIIKKTELGESKERKRHWLSNVCEQTIKSKEKRPTMRKGYLQTTFEQSTWKVEWFVCWKST